ncbi:MAG: hypothetical protein ACK5XN_32380 [Bacteroidota bacterium]|jgi:hypothetical protein
MSSELTIATLKVMKNGRVKEWMDFNDNATIPMVMAMAKELSGSKDQVIIDWYADDMQFVFDTNKMSRITIDVDLDNIEPASIPNAPAMVNKWVAVANKVIAIEDISINDKLSFIWSALRKEQLRG